MKIARLAFGVGALTFISRILGYVRDVAIAFFLGAGLFNDAFVIALRIPNMFRSIFGEGALNSAFVPIFTKKIKQEGEGGAIKFASNVQTILLIITTIFSALMIYFMNGVVELIAPGYSSNPEALSLITNLGRISFCYIIFISMMAFYGGISNSFGNYMPFASAPIILNVILILFIFLGNSQEQKAYWLTISLPIAGIFEMLWVMYFVYKHMGIISIQRPVMDSDTKLLLKRMLPGIIGSGISQINIVVSTIIASFVASGVSYLYYADRIYQLPLAIIGTALGTVMLPELAKKYASGDVKKFKVMQNQALVFSLFLTMPASLGILAIAPEIISLLFQHGAFDQQATNGAAAALEVFALGLPAFCIIKIFSAAFFASGDTKTPVRIAAVVLLINIVISIVLLPLFQHVAVAIGAVVASLVNAGLLGYFLKRKSLYFCYKKSYVKIAKIIGASFLMYLCILILKNFVHSLPLLAQVCAYMSVSSLIYFGLFGFRKVT
ncbi:MAG: murein biosynthesis integral membrane protein MurJ [Candidatus Jidaibacter sp.]|jgi:putative peptidoglycan lipid II flippase|nr:murein biosynthesis integral membrane protein MurJ [Candidatus Jidaibacter sp.]